MLDTSSRYQIEDRLGSGAMGDVYKAIDSQTQQTVAVKVLKPELLRHDPGLLTRFRREGEALRDLNHPNIVSLLDVFSHEDEHFLVMEYVAGGDLAGLLRDMPQGLSAEKALALSLDLADALTRAHRINIIHRDIKPANILIAEDGTPRLSDFGIAMHREGERLTDSNAIIGTLSYIAPEVFNGQPADQRSDIWAFGIILFEMLTGRHPYTGDIPASMIASILTEPVPDLEEISPKCPLGLVDLVYRMLIKDPQGRIPSVRLVGAEIESLIQGFEIPERGGGRSLAHESSFATPVPSQETNLRNLPTASTPFVGRRHELADIAAQMESCRLLTLLGPGGMGKSRLSIEAASQLSGSYERGAHFVGLAPIAAADQIVPAIAEAIGFQFYPGSEPQQQLFDFLQAKEMLLLLDNFEHVLDGAGLVTDLLNHAPKLKVITTSRERLKLSAECIFDVPGLQMPQNAQDIVFEDFEAVEMFLAYAQRVQPDYEVRDEDKPAIVRICQLVGGMPLGIELAAGWARSMSPQEVADELEADLDILSTELADVPDRQRSMRAAFDYSWRRLSDEEQDAFMKFSVFRGGATREAARSVSGASIRTLTSLVDKSMLRRDPSSGRFEVHELMRQFGEEHLRVDHSVWMQTRDRHCEYFAEYLQINELAVRWTDYVPLIVDLDNLRVGLDWAIEHTKLIELYIYVDLLALLYMNEGLTREMDIMLDRSITLLEEQPSPDEHATALLGFALLFKGKNLHWRAGRPADAKSYLARGLALLESTSHHLTLARARSHAADCFYDEPEESIRLLEPTLEVFEGAGSLGEVARSLNVLGYLYDTVGEADRGWDCLERALDLGRELNIDSVIAHALLEMCLLSGRRKERDSARTYCLESLRISELLPSATAMIMTLGIMAMNELLAGEYQAAYEYSERGLALAEERGLLQDQYIALCRLGYIAESKGDLTQARAYHDRALALSRQRDNTRHVVMCLANLGHVAARSGDRERAVDHFRDSRTNADYWIKVRMLSGGAWLHLLENNFESSAEHLGAFDVLGQEFVDQDEEVFVEGLYIEPVLRHLKEKLSPDLLEASLDRGRKLDPDSLIQKLID